MTRILFAILALVFLSLPVSAQLAGLRIVNACGAPNTQSYPLMSIDLNGNLCVGAASENGISPAIAGAAASNVVLKNAPGTLFGAYAVCTAACYLMVFNATSAPADGATTAGTASGNLQDCVPIAANGTNGVNYAPGPGESFSVGITAVISSTACGTKTSSAVGFIHGSAR